MVMSIEDMEKISAFYKNKLTLQIQSQQPELLQEVKE
jgi:hypothetical protein